MNRHLAAVVRTRHQAGIVQQGIGRVEAREVSDLAPDHRCQHVTEAGDGPQKRHLGESRGRCLQFHLARFPLFGEKIVQAKHPLEAQLRRLRKPLLLDPGSPLGREDAPLGPQPVHLQQAIHAVFRLCPLPRNAAPLPRQQPQRPDGRGRKPSLRQRLHAVHRQFLHQSPRVQPVRLLLAQTVDPRRVHPVRPLAPSSLLQHAHHKISAGGNFQSNLRFRRQLRQALPPRFPRALDRLQHFYLFPWGNHRHPTTSLVYVRRNRYHRLASSLNFSRRPSLTGPEEASLFHNITVSAFLTVGFSIAPRQPSRLWTAYFQTVFWCIYPGKNPRSEKHWPWLRTSSPRAHTNQQPDAKTVTNDEWRVTSREHEPRVPFPVLGPLAVPPTLPRFVYRRKCGGG